MSLGYAVDALARWLSGSPDPAGWALALAVLVVWVAPIALLVFPLAALGRE